MNLKQKNISLFIGILGLFWIAYQLSFSKSFEMRQQYHNLIKEQELFTNVSEKLVQLKQQNEYNDSILKSKKISTESSYQNNLLEIITSFADSTKIKIVDFNSPHIYKTDNTDFSTFSFKLNGSFSKITQLIYQLEQNFKLGRIISVNFEKKKNYRRNVQFLECTILLQLAQEV